MIKVVAKFLLKPEHVDEAIALAKELVTETRKEKGCIQYDLVQAEANPAELVVLETWESQAVLDIHSASAHFTRIVPAIAGMCQQAPAVDRYTQLI